MPFEALSAADALALAVDGKPLAELSGEALASCAGRAGLPRSLLGDEQQTRIVLGALLTLGAKAASALAPGSWEDVREEARGLLLLAVRREGCVSASTAAALNVLNQPQVVEKYKALGNRWTIAESSRDAPGAVELARKELGADGPLKTSEWLRGLADTLEAPVEERSWYMSKMVLLVLFLTAIFVLGHVVLLVRVLQKVHLADNRVLLYPIAGLSASAAVGAFAIGVHKLSEPPKRE